MMSEGGTSAGSVGSTKTLSDKLRELEQAKANGLISQSEFAEAKSRLLNAHSTHAM